MEIIGDVNVDVGTEIDLVVSEVATAEEALIGHITRADVVFRALSGALNREVILLLGRERLNDGIVPVGRRGDSFGGQLLASIGGRPGIIDGGFVVKFRPLLTIAHGRHVGRHLDTGHCFERQDGALGTARLCRYNNDAVGATTAVDRTKCILDDGNALDVIGVKSLENIVTGHLWDTIHNVKRVAEATNVDAGGEGAWLTVFLTDLQTGYLSGQILGKGRTGCGL